MAKGKCRRLERLPPPFLLYKNLRAVYRLLAGFLYAITGTPTLFTVFTIRETIW
jgi:hypothetical protein